MPTHATSGRDRLKKAILRRLSVALLAVAQLGIVGVGPFIDAAPAPPGHELHLASDTDGGCHPYHDEHCVVCRVVASDPLAAGTDLEPPVAAPARALAVPVPSKRAPTATAASPLQPRAPPIA